MAANYTIFTKFAAVDAMSATLNKIQGRVAAMTTSLNKAQTSTGNVLKGLGDQAIMRGIGLAAIGSGILLKNAIQTAAEFESIKTAISFASGGGENAAKNLQFLSETVKNLNVDYSVTAEGFKRFLGAMRSTNIEADKQREMFYKMASATKVMGLNSESTERVFYALGEMFSKGQVMSQELKLQLGNAMPGAVADFAASMKKPQAEFRKLMEAGKVGTEHIAGYIDFIYEKTKGGVEAASRTMLSQLTALETSWKMMLEQIGIALNDAGVLDILTKIMSGVRDWVEANKELIKSGFKEFLDSLVVGFKWIYNNWDAIVEGLKTWITVWALMKGVNLVLQGTVALLELITVATGPAGIIIGIAAIAAGWLLISTNTDTAANSVRTFADEIRETEGVWNQAGKYFSVGFGDVVLDFFNTLLYWVGQAYVGILEMLRLLTKTGLFGDSLDKTIRDSQAWANTWGTTFDTAYNREIPGSQNISQGSQGVLVSKAQTIASKYGVQSSSLWGSPTGVGVMANNDRSVSDYSYSSGNMIEKQEGLIPNSAYSQSLENKLEVIIKTDSKDTTAEVVKSSGAMPVSVTINNK